MNVPNQAVQCLIACCIAACATAMAGIASIVGFADFAAFWVFLYRECILIVIFIIFTNVYKGEM